MSRVAITDIEDALIARLREAVPSANTVKAYRGDKSFDAIVKTLSAMPAIFTMYFGSKSEPLGSNRRTELMSFVLLVAASSFGMADQDGKTGAEAQVYTLLEEIMLALDGYELVAGGFPIIFQGQEPADRDQQTVVFAAEYTVKQAYFAVN